MYREETEKITFKKVLLTLAALALILSATVVIYQTFTDPRPAIAESQTAVVESQTAIAESQTVITFQDKELERLMRSALNKQSGDIVLGDIEDIKVVDVVGICIQVKRTSGPYFGDKVDYHTLFSLDYGANGEIYAQRGDLKTLEDFKQFPKLQSLYIEYQDNPDISAVPDIKNLTQLQLLNDNITDISALANCTQLKTLDLTNNPIADYSPLVSLTHTYMNQKEWTYEGYKRVHGQ